MYCVLIVAAAILNISVASKDPSSKHNIQIDKHNRNYGVQAKKTSHNLSFIDKDENQVRLPTLSKYFTEHKSLKIKKSPKRTIQKIIKKNKGKLRKIYIHQVKKSTSQPKFNIEKKNDQSEMKMQKLVTTTEKHMHKNRNTKLARYQHKNMPFHKLQKKKDGRRSKRGLSRELFILKDLDQLQFLSKEKDNDVINAHISNYWQV